MGRSKKRRRLCRNRRRPFAEVCACSLDGVVVVCLSWRRCFGRATSPFLGLPDGELPDLAGKIVRRLNEDVGCDPEGAFEAVREVVDEEAPLLMALAHLRGQFY